MRFPPILKVARAALLMAGVSAAAACGDKAVPDSAAVTPAPVPRPPSPGDSTCPRDGLWKPCALEDRLIKSGLAFKPAGDSARVPYLTVPGVRYKVGKSAALLVFFYADSAAAAADVEPLDARRLTPRGDTIGAWPSVPTEVVRSANVLAVLFDASATQAERVRLSLTAGAPQPYAAPAAQSLPPTVVK